MRAGVAAACLASVVAAGFAGPAPRRFRTPGGFTCARVSGGRLAGQRRCVRGPAAYRFESGD